MLRTGGNILSNLAGNTSTDVKHRHIIAKHVSDWEQNLIQKLRGKGHKRAATLKARGIPTKKKAKKKAGKNTKINLFIGRTISYPTMAADVVSASTEFDIFATRPVQTSNLETIETTYKPIASLDQSDLDFLIPQIMTHISI